MLLGSELWAQNDFSYLLTVVKEFIVDVWELKQLKSYGKDTCPGPQSDSSRWDRDLDGRFRNGRNYVSVSKSLYLSPNIASPKTSVYNY